MNTKILTYIILLALFSFTATAALTDGLVQKYSFTNGNLTSLVNNYLLTNTGALNTSAGFIGTAYNFTATGNHITNTTDTVRYVNITVCGWFNKTGDGGWVAGATHENALAGNTWVNIILFTIKDSATNGVQVRNPSIGTCADTSWVMPNNTWTHICLQASASNTSIYINGILNKTTTTTCYTTNVEMPTWLSNNPAQSTTWYQGIIDELTYWNRILSASEILNVYNYENSGSTYPWLPSAPVIVNSTYNLTTSASGWNSTAWRTSTANLIKTLDTTPTVTFNTTLPAYCRIDDANSNWTTMGNTRNCTTTGTSSHVCTLPAADQYTLGSGYNSLYIACIDSTLAVETALSTSGALNLTLGTTPYATGTNILPDPAYVDSVLNCSFTVYDTDSSLINVSVNWNSGAYWSNFTNVVNGTFLNSSWTPAYPEGTNVSCNVTVTDGESSGMFTDTLTISNSAPYGFSVSNPADSSMVFANWTSVNWVCSDVDAETLTGTFWVNGTINGTATNSTSFNLSGLAYDTCFNLTSRCGDGTDFTAFDYRTFCTNSSTICSGMSVGGLADAERYIGLVHEVEVLCSGGYVPPSCSWSTNGYAPNVVNCSSFNVTLENGRNYLVFVSHDDVNTTVSIRVWGKDSSADVFDFVLLWVFLLIYIGCLVLGAWTGLGFMYLVSWVPGFFMSLEVFGISWYAGSALLIIVGTVGLVLVMVKR